MVDLGDAEPGDTAIVALQNRGRLSWHGLPIDGMTREQLIEVVYQLMAPNDAAQKYAEACDGQSASGRAGRLKR